MPNSYMEGHINFKVKLL